MQILSITLIEAAFLALPFLATSLTLDCSQILINLKKYDLSSLGGPHVVQSPTESTPPSTHVLDFTVDICGVLGKDSSLPDAEQCPNGTRICGVERESNSAENKTLVEKVIPVAGDFIHDGLHLDPIVTRLRGSDSSADANKEGIRLQLNGGEYPFRKKDGKSQKAFIEFLCDPERTGNEGHKDEDKNEKKSINGNTSDKKVETREEGKDDENEPDVDPNTGKSLKFISYGEEDDGKTGVLRLKWYTKYACEGVADSQPSGKSKHWGFFTWFIIILFLVVATYLVFGSWLNYNRYGSRGLDLLPHGDTIRDLPYLLKDWARQVVNTFSGDSRGGYSAV